MGVEIDGKDYTAQEISARILQKLKRDAEAFLGEPITEAVITVPAYFGDAQRQATKEAGQIAGLEVLRIVNEPTAASLAYGLDKEHDQPILVFDLGGGTFDVSVLEIGEGVFEVKSTHGDTQLGGDDWDERIIDWLVELQERPRGRSGQGPDGADPAQGSRREGQDRAVLGARNRDQPALHHRDPEGPIHLLTTLSRSEFEQMTEDLLERTRAPFGQVIKDAGVSVGDVDHIILVGGSTRMPAVQALVKELAGKDPSKGVNPDEVVALGPPSRPGCSQET